MRAETLGDAGRKLEILNGMLENEIHCRDRMLRIQARIDSLLEGRSGRKPGNRRKKHTLIRLRERLGEKLSKKESSIRRMKEHKETLFRNLILQREALGVLDHSWIHQFYD